MLGHQRGRQNPGYRFRGGNEANHPPPAQEATNYDVLRHSDQENRGLGADISQGKNVEVDDSEIIGERKIILDGEKMLSSSMKD